MSQVKLIYMHNISFQILIQHLYDIIIDAYDYLAHHNYPKHIVKIGFGRVNSISLFSMQLLANGIG